MRGSSSLQCTCLPPVIQGKRLQEGSLPEEKVPPSLSHAVKATDAFSPCPVRVQRQSKNSTTHHPIVLSRQSAACVRVCASTHHHHHHHLPDGYKVQEARMNKSNKIGKFIACARASVVLRAEGEESMPPALLPAPARASRKAKCSEHVTPRAILAKHVDHAHPLSSSSSSPSSRHHHHAITPRRLFFTD